MTSLPPEIAVRGQLLKCYRDLPREPSLEQQKQARKIVQEILTQLGSLGDAGLPDSIRGCVSLIGRRIGDPALANQASANAFDQRRPATAPGNPASHSSDQSPKPISAKAQLKPVSTAPLFAGKFTRYPDLTGKRLAEGGRRLDNASAPNAPEKPLVTIITAVYDNEESLQRCIDSVQAQTYKNIEHIIIDGGSPQGTRDILEANAGILEYYISEPDKGIYAAMNKGIELAQGQYVCLLNSDDYYEPEFVEKSVGESMASGADIVYTDYWHGEAIQRAQIINEGVLLGHLNICHNTFLARKESYDKLGPFVEDFKIVSDAVWIRAAFRQGLRFQRLSEPMFTLSPGGLSSGGTEAHRRLFINEVVESYRREFPDLMTEEAEDIYLLRFNKQRVHRVVDVARRHCPRNHMLRRALGHYVEYCFGERANFVVERSEPIELFKAMIELADVTGADRKCLRVKTKNGLFGDLLSKIDALAARRKAGAKRTVLHFVTVFSAPSETFIYDLVTNMQADERYDNFILFEHQKLGDERPFDKAHQIFVNDYPPEIVQELYRYLVDVVKPDVLVAHFAINEHRFHHRSSPGGVQVPTVVMTHGIDVFLLKRPGEYRDYVLNELAQRKDVRFTAVSEYLFRELVSAGVPAEKIVIVPNSVNPRFLEYRKCSGFYDRSRTLRLLSIGRLIELKAHDVLIDALAQFRDACTDDFELTIVYGGAGDRLSELQAQGQQLGLDAQIKFERFINFRERPDYLSQFDIYVHPSSYSRDEFQRGESFGVAVLEAILAGLPVITTDAGGLPDVIGVPNPHARIVAHRNAQKLFEALRELYEEGEGFSDNISYARERLQHFSPQAQLDNLSAVIESVCRPPVRVAMFSTSTIQGAGYAAYRVFRGLRDTSVKAHMFTTVRNHENDPDVTVIPHPSGDNGAWASEQLKPPPGMTIFTLDRPHLSNEALLRVVEPYDIINLHWHARFLSIDNIAALTRSGKPVVMTIRDMMPITGGCHFFHGCDRWRKDCELCPQMPEPMGRFPGRVVAKKRANYDFSNLTLVAISNHSRKILEQTPYFRDCRIETIPNSIELDVFKPYDKIEQRKALGLPLHRKIIGYVPSFSSEVKGYREFLEALNRLGARESGGNPFVMLVGNETPATRKIRQDKKVLGYINDNERLAKTYCAADLVVVPSLEETFSNTAAEAIACGVPVVGFKTGAIPDLAVDGVTGYSYDPGDVAGLADGIVKVFNGPDMTKACRENAEAFLSFMIQARSYEKLFRELAVGSKQEKNRQL